MVAAITAPLPLLLLFVGRFVVVMLLSIDRRCHDDVGAATLPPGNPQSGGRRQEEGCSVAADGASSRPPGHPQRITIARGGRKK